ncbi:MAG: translocation/assembly module TamB domain-containing protein [Oceanicoccus sp.]
MIYRLSAKHFLRRALASAKWCTVILVIAATLILIAGGTAIGSEWGRVWLTQTVVDRFNQTTQLHIGINNLATPRLGHWTATSINVSKNQQIWIVIDELNIKWQPAALFDKNIIIEKIQAAAVSLHKLPADDQDDENSFQAISDLLLTIPSVQLKTLTIPSLNLYGFGPVNDDKKSLHYAIFAKASWLENSPLQITMEARGLDAIPATINLHIQSYDWHDASLQGSLHEDAGGFFGELLQLPKQQAIQAQFDVAVTTLSDRFGIKLKNINFPIAKRSVVARGNVAVSPENNAIYVDDLALSIDDSHHSLTGSWFGQQLDFELSLNNFPLDISKPWQNSVTSGDLSAQLKVSGTAVQPKAQGHITLTADYKQLPIVVDFVGLVSKSLVSTDNLHVRLANSDILAKGNVNLEKNTMKLKVSASSFDLGSLAAFNIPLPDNLKATVTAAEATIHGSIKNPQGKLNFTANGEYEKQPFSLQSRLTKNDTTISIQQAELGVADGNISFEGSLQPETLDANIIISAESLAISPLKLIGIDLPETLEAKISTQLNLNGNLRNPAITGEAQLQGIYQTIPFVLNASGHHQDNNSQLQKLELSAFDEQVFTAAGHYQAGQFDLRAQAEKIPSQLLSVFGWYLQPGKFGADIHARGSLQNPTLNGYVNYATVLNGYDNEGDKKDINVLWNLDINTDADVVSFKSTLTRDNYQPALLLLKIPAQPYIHYLLKQNQSPDSEGIPLHASLKGDFSLQTVSFLLNPDTHLLTGDLNTDMVIGGTFAKPSLTGMIHINEARYENPVTGTVIEDIDCVLTAEKITLNVDSCQATDGHQGQYALTGAVDLPVDHSLGRVDMKLQSQSANVLRRPDIESEATGEILLSGDFTSLLATGNLEVAPFTAVFDTNFSSGIARINVEEIESLQDLSPPISRKISAPPTIRFDLVITASQQAYLRGHGLEAELEGKIEIHGDLKKPLYDGEFRTVRGYFDLFNKKFDLEQGQVNFANNTLSLAVVGIYENDDQRIRADMSGTNDEIKISFSAVPSIPEDEILAFIIFGKPIQSITAFEAVQLALAVQKLQSGGSSFFDPIGKTRDVLGIDTLSIESAENEAGDNSVNVGIGKYLNEKVYLELERTPNPSQPWKGNLDIEVTPDIDLRSSTGTQGDIERVELKWKSDY